jgi:gamma-butyrobetaine dioxygenase
MLTDEIFSLYEGQGASAYFGEAVTVAEHGLQTAYFAEKAGASDGLTIAALLHDIGHLIELAPTDVGDWVADAYHERVGSLWLARHFGPQVSEPVRLHVGAKRYLCAIKPGYFRALSPASVVTLGLQGGPMSMAEANAFEMETYFEDAVRLRQWDDKAKIPGLPTPNFVDYRTRIENIAKAFQADGTGDGEAAERQRSLK